MLQGVRCLIVGASTKQREILAKIFAQYEGIMLPSRPPAIFGPSPLPSDLTHILVESRDQNRESLCKSLNCNEIPAGVSIVHSSWLHDSVKRKERQAEENYSIAMKTESDEKKSGDLDSDICHSETKKVASSAETIDPLLAATSSTPRVPMCNLDGRSLDKLSNVGWNEFDSVLARFDSLPENSNGQVIGFDLDHTLIKTVSGNVFPRDENDWMLWDSSVKRRLQQLHEEGYVLLIISNQSGVSSGKATQKQIHTKVSRIIEAIGVPMDFICSTEDDLYRKPRTGMWDFWLQCWKRRRSGADAPQLAAYVGDGAGRPAEGKRKKDFSDSDLKFALNAGCLFKTPEVFFCSSRHPLHACCSTRSGVILSSQRSPIPDETLESYVSSRITASLASDFEEILLIVAPPASGKSTIAKTLVNLSGYQRINQDTLKSLDKCLRVARSVLEERCLTKARFTEDADNPAPKKPRRTPVRIVVDNTNVSVATRKAWVSLAREFEMPIRCVCLQGSVDISLALEKFRVLNPLTSIEDKRPIPSWVITKTFNEMTQPSRCEGFDAVETLPFVCFQSNDQLLQRLLDSYLI